MQLDIILRTHSGSSVHAWATRYASASKAEILLRCVNSLVTSINQANTDPSLTEASIHLAVFDDHSDEDTLIKLRAILAKCACEVKLFATAGLGNNASMVESYAYAKEAARDAVYFVEDDYLHAPSAIAEMIGAYGLFTKNLGREVALYPTDYPDRYLPQENDLCRVVLGPKRHWRTVTHSTFTCFVSAKLLRNRWSAFDTLATKYGTGGFTEENTINALWRTDAILFSPIPTLVLHMQFAEHKDPYINWQEWWDAAKYDAKS